MATSFKQLLSEARTPFMLAPIAGVSDSSFRLICSRFGAGMTVSEMISAKGLYYKNENTGELLRIREGEAPVGIQFFGSEPAMLGFAAKESEKLSNAFLNINMGCPVPKVVKNGEGSALLASPATAEKLVSAMSLASAKPVTVKMRIGFGAYSIDPAEFARRMEAAGAQAIMVHGRTREQFYSGTADWSEIKRIKKAVNVPVIGNGDVFSAKDALNMMDETDCDGVMIGRAAFGNPWIFRECEAAWKGEELPPRPETEEIIAQIKEHAEMISEVRGEYTAVREMRKHVSWYTKGIPGAAALRRIANNASSFDELFSIIDGLA